ncbi:MAG: hypothetical protein H6728_13805 [Myxococcales bacterium]|nr:hypothetical protein [Myxococcales bacterium]
MTTRLSTPQVTTLEQYARLSARLSRFPLLLQKLHHHGPQAPEVWNDTLQQILPHQAMIMLYHEAPALLWKTAPVPSFQSVVLHRQELVALQASPPLTLGALPSPLKKHLASELNDTPLVCAEVTFLQKPLGLLVWLPPRGSSPHAQDYQLAELLAEQVSALFMAWSLLPTDHSATDLVASLSPQDAEAPHLPEDLESISDEGLTAPHSTSSIQRLQQRTTHAIPSRESLLPRQDTTPENPLPPQPSPSKEWLSLQDATSTDQKPAPPIAVDWQEQLEQLQQENKKLTLSLQQRTQALESNELAQQTQQKTLQYALHLGEQLRQKLFEYAQYAKESNLQLIEFKNQERFQSSEPYEQLNQTISRILPKLQRSLGKLEEHTSALEQADPQIQRISYQFTSASRSLLNYLAQWSDYNRCILGQITPESSTFSMVQLLEQLKRDFRPQLEHKSLHWRWELQELKQTELEGDEEIVRSLLALIVGYAIDQSQNNGRILLTLRHDPNSPLLHLHFEHSHPEIEPHELRALLDPFQEEETPIIPRLSLALAKQLSLVHQGKLELRALEGRLSVHLELPVKLAQAPKTLQPRNVRPHTPPPLPNLPEAWKQSFVQQLRQQRKGTPQAPSMSSPGLSTPSKANISPPPHSPYTSASQQRMGSASQQHMASPSQQRMGTPSQQRMGPPSQQRMASPSQQRMSQQRLPAPKEEPIVEFIELAPNQDPPAIIDLLRKSPSPPPTPPNRAPYGVGKSSTYGQLDVLAKQFPLYPLAASQPEAKSTSLFQQPAVVSQPPPNQKATSLIYCTPSALGEDLELSEGLRFLQYENHPFQDLEELALLAQQNKPRMIWFGPEDLESPIINELRTRVEGNVRFDVPLLERQANIDFYRFHWGAYRSLPFSASHLIQWLQSVRIARPRQEKQLLVTGPSTLWGETAPLLQFFCGQRYRIHVEANPQTCARNLHRNPPDLLLVQIDRDEAAWKDFFYELHHAAHLPSPPLLIFALAPLSQELSLLLQPLQQLLFLPAERR